MKKYIFVLFAFVALVVSTNTLATNEEQMAIVFADKLIEKAINKGEEQIVYMHKMKKILIVAKENRKSSLKTRKILEALFFEFDNRIKQYEALNPIENTNHVVENNQTQAQEVSIEAKREEMLKAINEYRKKQGLDPYVMNERVNKVAQDYAELLDKNNEFSHSFQGELADRLEREGIEYWSAEENLSRGYLSVDNALIWWKKSPNHNITLLFDNSNYIINIWLWYSAKWEIWVLNVLVNWKKN